MGSDDDGSRWDAVEEPLDGGFVNSVVRVGRTVRRSGGQWTPAVHALLNHLEGAGFAEAPRVLGMDRHGREVLTYIPGVSIGWRDWPQFMRGDAGLAQLGSVLRRYHQAVQAFRPAPDLAWRNPLAPAEGELIRHGDFSPFNTIWRSETLVGVIDWDFAQPGSAISDLAYLAWYAVPLMADQRVAEYGFRDIDRAARLRTLCRAYGRFSPADVVNGAISVIEAERDQTKVLAEADVYPWTTFAADGALQSFDAEADWIRSNQRLLM